MTAVDTTEAADIPGETPAGLEMLDKAPASRLRVYSWRLAIILAFLALWQWIPKIPNINAHITFLDPFFISSPSLIAVRIWHVCTGTDNTPLIWSAVWFTVYTALLGTLIAIAIGALGGLVLSNSETLERVVKPIVSALNAVPRIAIIPIVVIIAKGPASADIIAAVAVVVFLVFYNALEGGRSVPLEMIESARIMGARPSDVMWTVRLPYVAAWVFAALPNAFAFGLVGSVTTELFTGAPGVGHQLSLAVDSADSTLTFTVVIILTVIGVLLVQLSDFARKKVLPWWNA